MILKVQMEKTDGKDFVSFCKMVATDTIYFAIIYKTSCSTALKFIRSNI